jgi:peptide/nickel transport system permease protein
MASAYEESPVYKAWKRMKKNKPAMVSLSVIILAAILAIIGPAIAPDRSPNANDQILEIANMRPGFKIQVLKLRKDRQERDVNSVQGFLKGRENPYTMVPITGYKINGDKITVQLFKGVGATGEAATYSLVDVLYPLSITSKEVAAANGKVTFTDYNENKRSEDIAQLQKKVENNIVLKTYRFGTDGYGRDILSRMLFGVRVSISVGLVAVFISLTIGIFLGAIAGYFRGRTDDFIMWIINVVWAIPTILLAMAISFALGNIIDRFWVIYIAVGLSMWVDVARLVRGQVMQMREMEFVQAARGLGFNSIRIIFKHIMPNIIGPIMVITAANFASAILIEAGLSFVGIGVQPPMPSWGVMLNDHRHYLTSHDKAFLALIPGFAVMILILAFNILGNGLRDAFDVKSKTFN